MLPEGIEVMLAPMDDPIMYANNGPGFWRQPLQGFDFTCVETMELQQGRAAQETIDPGSLLPSKNKGSSATKTE